MADEKPRDELAIAFNYVRHYIRAETGRPQNGSAVSASELALNSLETTVRAMIEKRYGNGMM